MARWFWPLRTARRFRHYPRSSPPPSCTLGSSRKWAILLDQWIGQNDKTQPGSFEETQVPSLYGLAPSTSLWVTRIERGQPRDPERRTQ